MQRRIPRPSRRDVIGGVAAAMTAGGVARRATAQTGGAVATRAIPSSGERIPVVGLGSWITFNVGDDPRLLAESQRVIAAFFADGGRLIDCSPMYGSSQATIGHALKALEYPRQLFSAEKVWTSWGSSGPEQIAATRNEWGVERFDLLQVHNLLAWEAHLETLRQMKADGSLRYIGVTTSHGRRHGDVERIMTTQAIDFVQVTYNVVDREVEARILPIAAERGIAVIVNRPYQRGALVDRLKGKPLPGWAGEAGVDSWAQFLLKFIVSHPAVTCAIPATTRVDHVRENLGVAGGIMPDPALRRRMADYVGQL